MLKKRKEKPSDQSTQLKPLRLLPGIIIVVVQWLLRYALPAAVPDDSVMIMGVAGGLLCGLAVVVWWAFFSRAPGIERWGAIILMIVALVATSRFIHASIATGNMGYMFIIHSIPVMSLAFVAWAVVTHRFSQKIRRVTMIATILVVCVGWMLVRSDGITGYGDPRLTWRWAETHEERLLAQAGDEPMALPLAPETTEAGAEWPGFRGSNRDGIVRGVRVETDWSASPPVELWRRPIGPGCSSFAVRGGFLYTQEQRGDHEVVACYKVTTGEPVWRHRDKARFWDSHAGAGPRGTPTLSNGRVYTLGATGILNVLDAHDGALVWSQNAASDTDTEVPEWGFTSSPLVVDDAVIVAVEGTLVAYDLSTGDLRWSSPDGGGSYSSPHLLTIDGVTQVLFMSEVGATSIAPADGKVLWEHKWPGGGRIVQPALVPDGDVLICSGGISLSLRRIKITQGIDGWDIEEQWTSHGLKPNHNDFVVHEDYAFGFNGPRLACIDVKDGKRMWQGGRYGGQLLLLAEQDLLLVITEKGDLALVMAGPDKLTELARIPAIKGKTWNHPVLAGDILVVRNSQEMAAFRLSFRDD
jgi:outer membrane protein assembly factor BamB